MQFIRPPKLIAIAERELPQLVADCMNRKCVQNINVRCDTNLWVDMLMTAAIEWLTCWIPHRRCIRDFTHRASDMSDLSNAVMFGIIRYPGSQKSWTLPLESITTIGFQAWMSCVYNPEWEQSSPNFRMPSLISISGSLVETCEQPEKNPCAFSDWSWKTFDTSTIVR